MTASADLTEALQARVALAVEQRQPLALWGGGTKHFLGRRPAHSEAAPQRLEIGGHCGIVDYDPAELVLTARAGTPLVEIEALLADHGQMLGFEPPHFGSGATLGGAVACGWSGPRRPFAGSVRDSVLGCRLINGRAEVLSLGGRVMKNVAGFDLSRLMVGSMGTLGLLLELSIKVLPRPDCERTLVFPMRAGEALKAMNRWAGQPWPLTGLAADDSWTWVRLAGTEAALAAVEAALGGDRAVAGANFWQGLKEQRSRFFSYPPLGEQLWRISLAPATPPLDLPGHWLYDWGGALRWLRTEVEPGRVWQAAEQAGGHATRVRGAGPGEAVFQPLPPALGTLHRQVKQALDPHGLFNPGRLYAAF